MARLLLIAGFVLGLLSSAMYMLDPYLAQLYIFTPGELAQLSTAGLAAHGNDTAAVVSYIVERLAQQHPDHVNLDEEWIFNNAGGAMGAMYIIHASVTEYLIIFGTAIGTEGHTGRHTADDYFHILKGEQLAYAPGRGVYEPEVYGQGSVHHLKRGMLSSTRWSRVFCTRVCEGVDSAHVVLWVCGYVVEHAGFPDVVADDVCDGPGDDWESDEGEVVGKMEPKEILLEEGGSCVSLPSQA